MSLNTENEEHRKSKPVTVSSTSSMETAASFHNERTNFIGTQAVSSEPSLIRTAPSAVCTPQFGSRGAAASKASLPSSISLVQNPLRSPATGIVIPSIASPNAVPEFLYQLTKMLTDNNREIEWSCGKIEVHNPHKLQTHVLNRYFRHSKFASFQRQLNYFGFRKLAGKGKMAPCSYVNDATTNELRSLLHIKRKTGNEPKSKTEKKRTDRMVSSVANKASGRNGGLRASNQAGESTATYSNIGAAPQHSQQAIARVAVGKGIRHSFSLPSQSKRSQPVPVTTPSSIEAAPTQVQSNLSVLQSNFHTSLGQSTPIQSQSPPLGTASSSSAANPLSYVPGSLSRDDSLVDLAMLPMVDPTQSTESVQPTAGGTMPFIDFPFDPSMFEDDLA